MEEKVYNINYEIDLNDCYLWQYDKAERLNSLLNAKNDFYKTNVSDFWGNWTTDVFNIDTANTFGLNLWGQFLDVKRPSYEESGETVVFNDEQYRTLLKGRVMLMNSNGSIESINKYTEYLFKGKIVFTVDYFDMSMNIVFYYEPTAEEMAVITMDGFLPRPAGVNVNYIIVPPELTFGFDGQELSNFDNGTFFA